MYQNLPKYHPILPMILKIQYKKEFKKFINKPTKIMKLFVIFTNKSRILKGNWKNRK